MSRRGHAAEFATETIADQTTMELVTASYWINSMHATSDHRFTGLYANPQTNDVPDCFAVHQGQQISIELTELVDPKILARISHELKKTGQQITSHDQLFYDAQWDEQRFFQELIRCLTKKQKSYEGRDIVVDYLIVHTAEPWLEPTRVGSWLENFKAPLLPNLREIFLLMNHRPGYAEHWPIFQIRRKSSKA